MYVVEFGMGRGARNIDHLALVGNVLHMIMNASKLHFSSMVFADMHFRGNVNYKKDKMLTPEKCFHAKILQIVTLSCKHE